MSVINHEYINVGRREQIGLDLGLTILMIRCHLASLHPLLECFKSRGQEIKAVLMNRRHSEHIKSIDGVSCVERASRVCGTWKRVRGLAYLNRKVTKSTNPCKITIRRNGYLV